MMRQLITTAALLLLPLAAHADCRDRLEELDDARGKVQLQSQDEMQYRTLRAAADVAAKREQEETCTALTESMDELLEQARKAAAETAAKQRLQQAPKFSELPEVVRASQLIDAAVRNGENQQLGRIVDVAIDPSGRTIAYLAMEHGGFLGIGESLIPIPISAARWTKDQVVVVDITREALKQAPSFDEDNWPSPSDAKWQAKVREFFNTARQQRPAAKP